MLMRGIYTGEDERRTARPNHVRGGRWEMENDALSTGSTGLCILTTSSREAKTGLVGACGRREASAAFMIHYGGKASLPTSRKVAGLGASKRQS